MVPTHIAFENFHHVIVVAKAQAQKFNVVGDYGDAYAGAKDWAVTIPFEFAGHNR